MKTSSPAVEEDSRKAHIMDSDDLPLKDRTISEVHHYFMRPKYYFLRIYHLKWTLRTQPMIILSFAVIKAYQFWLVEIDV